MYEKLDQTRHAAQLVQNGIQVVIYFLKLFIVYTSKLLLRFISNKITYL